MQLNHEHRRPDDPETLLLMIPHSVPLLWKLQPKSHIKVAMLRLDTAKTKGLRDTFT
jgi:hypothetical protein